MILSPSWTLPWERIPQDFRSDFARVDWSDLRQSGGVGGHVGVISDAHGSDAERAKGKAEIAVVEGEEGGVQVQLFLLG